MTYKIELKKQAEKDLFALAKSEPKSFSKAQSLIEELKLHPKTGSGKPEPLSGDRAGSGADAYRKNTGWCMKSTTWK